ncbi:MAG: hypothetical protein RBR06_06150 [Desulfuromonadaceae bacterium]|nr:hypothetical protein [Desulfuromonadaceae bacterium]
MQFIATLLKRIAKPLARVFARRATVALAQAARKAVAATEESMQGGSRSKKRKKAYHAIVDDLKTQGTSIGADVSFDAIDQALDEAVQALKDK